MCAVETVQLLFPAVWLRHNIGQEALKTIQSLLQALLQ